METSQPITYKIHSIDEGNGIVVVTTDRPVADGRRKKVIINGRVFNGRFRDSQCWIRYGKPLGQSYNVKI